MHLRKLRTMPLRKLLPVCLLVAALMPGCMPYRSSQGPMNSVYDKLECRVGPETLLVLLPGAYDRPQDFIEQQFVAAVRERRIHADIQLVDARSGYYKNQQILSRLEAEVIGPARQKGYKRIWFVGISLGGYGTLLYAMRNPKAMEGFFLMAPYMGPADLPAQIEKHGGLRDWSSSMPGNADLDLWRWLQGYGASKPNLPKAYLGYGANDRFSQPNGVMAQVLPQGQSFVVSGGHDWPTWRQLWSRFLDTAPLPRIKPAEMQCVAN